MADDKGTQIYNHDVAGLVSRIQRFITELTSSSSSSVSLMNAFDQARLKSYLDAITNYQVWVTANPQLDLPETNRIMWQIPGLVGVTDVENESVKDLLRMLHLACLELINCQSARVPSGLLKFDSDRLSSYVQKAQNFLSNYIQKTDPLDLPESSPQDAVTPAGRSGV